MAEGGMFEGVLPENWTADVVAAVRFLGLFLRYHLDSPPDIRRNTWRLLAMARRK